MLGAKVVVMAAHAAGRDAAVAAQCDGPPAAMALQDGPDSEVPLPPKTLRDIYNGGISNAAVAKAIEKDCGVKAAVARKVLNSLAETGMKEITRIGRFKLDKLARLKVVLGAEFKWKEFCSEWQADSFEGTPTETSCEGDRKSRTPAQIKG